MKKSFLRILSITVTLLLIVGMVMVPASAATPETGFTSTSRNKVTNTIYRASDAADAVDSEGNSLAWLSSDSTVWKFAVGSLGDTFKASSADFAAPVAEAQVEGGLKLSWTAPEGVEGTTTLVVIGDNYNKQITVTGNSVILGDVVDGDTYQVQVTVGDVSSQILTYQNLINPITVTNYAGKEIDIFSGANYTFADFIAHKDKIDENTGILFKIENVTDDPDLMLTHYYNLSTGDYNGDGEADISGTYMPRAETTHKSLQGDVPFKNIVGASFSWRMESGYINDENMYVQTHKEYVVDTTKTDRTRYFYGYDNTILEAYDSAKIKTFNNINIAVSGVDGASTTRAPFNTGYILVPFEAFSDEDIAELKENGVITLPTLGYYKYRAKNRLNALNAQGASNPDWTDVNIQQTSAYYDDTYPEGTAEEDKKIEAKVYYSEAAFINDYDAFVASCVDDTTTTIDSACLSSSTECKGTYLNTLTDGVLSDPSVSSTYTVATNNITYTTAAGEKMKLGFTVPTAGTYDISCPITADIAKGVYYRAIKETADGTKTVIQAETAYNGEKHLALLTEELAAGDTVWFEAWANSAATVIDLGIPQIATYSSGKYSYYNYLYDLTTANGATNRYYPKETNSIIDIGYFVNPFRIDTVTTATDETTGETITETTVGEIYEIAADSVATAEGISIVQDMLGVSKLKVGDTATELYNSLKPYEFTRGVNKGLFASDPSCRRVAGLDGAPNTYKASTGSACLYSDLQFYMNIGYGRSFAGSSSKERYYFNSGAYLRFTAPSDGSVYFAFAGGGTTSVESVILLNNSTVVSVGTDPTALKDTPVDVKKGDEVILCLATTSTHTYVDLREPTAVFTAAESTEKTVTFSEETDNLMPNTYAVDSQIVLPVAAKNGAIFQGWNDGTKVWNAGETYTVTDNVDFTAEYLYYGNLDGDPEEEVTATDLTIMRKMVLKYTDIKDKSDVADITGDIDANGEIELVDLVKMKKMSVGIDVTVGAR